MKKIRLMIWFVMSVCLTVPILVFLGCEIDSAESVIRQVNVNVTGTYRNPDGGNLVAQNTGNPVVQLDLRQSGDQLEGVDNNGMLFRGTIGNVVGDTGDSRTASYTLSGMTSVRSEVTVSGNFEVSGTESTMRGTWIEPTLYSTVYGKATVPLQPTNAPATNVVLTVAPKSVTIAANGSVTFTATGGTSPYTFTFSNPDLGTFTQSDNSLTYTGKGITGQNILTVTSGDGQTTTATINQSSSGTLTISPQSTTIGTTDSKSFTISGGTTPYDADVSNPAIGSITEQSGSSITYKASGAGTNRLTVTSTDNQAATATIIQK